MQLVIDRNRRLDRTTRWVAFAGLFALFLVAIGTCFDVTLRFLFSAPIDGLDDISQLVFAIVIATCFPAGLLQGHNITIRFLGMALGSRGEKWLEAFGSLVTLVFFVLFGWQFIVMTMEFADAGRTTMTVETPTAPWWWVTTAVVLFCIPVQLTVFFVRAWEAVTDGDAAPLFRERGEETALEKRQSEQNN